jgi:predicted flap endonuclease-1-like 5' DNA nuclease
MASLFLSLKPLTAGFAKKRSQGRFSRIPLWARVLGLFLIVVIVGIIIKLWAEEELGWPGGDSGLVPPPPTPEPTKPAVEAKPVQPAVGLEPEIQPPVETPAASPDNLKRVKGIGPKIETLLKENGIATFTQLAETEVSRLQALLDQAGWAKLAEPTTWPEQARSLAGEK